MNKDKFNRSIDNINVPVEKLMAREKAAIFQAKKKEKPKEPQNGQSWLHVGYVYLCLVLDLFQQAWRKPYQMFP